MNFDTKNKHFNNLRIVILLIPLLCLFVFVSAFSYTQTVFAEIQDSVFRLHVIANSDSKEDQDLKFVVRDNVINYINDLIKNSSSKEETLQIVNSHIDDIQTIAYNTVIDCGYNYTVKVNVGNYVFPKKKYGDITLPPGYYDALKIEIGKAEGQNWWCVMFPPLCFVDVTSGIVPDESKEQLRESLSSEEYDLISGNSPNIAIKFKIVEVLQNLNISGIFM